MEVESASSPTVPTAGVVVVGQQQQQLPKRPFLEGTAHSQTHIMTVNIDISDDNHHEDEGGTVVPTAKVNSNGSGGDNDSSVAGSNGSSAKIGDSVISSTNKGISSSVSYGSLHNHHHPHQVLRNGGGGGEIKRIQRTLVSEERLTAAWRKFVFGLHAYIFQLFCSESIF